MEHRQTEKHTDNNTNNSNAMSRTKQFDRNRTETADLISSFFSRSSSTEQTMSDATTMVDNETMTLANAVRMLRRLFRAHAVEARRVWSHREKRDLP